MVLRPFLTPWFRLLPFSSFWTLVASSLCFMNLWLTILVTLSFLLSGAAGGLVGTRSRFLVLLLAFCPDPGTGLSARPLTLRRNSVTKPYRLAPVDLAGSLALLREPWLCPAPARELVCRVHARPDWFWCARFHRDRSLEVDAEEGELRLEGEGRDCLRYSLGEEVECLDLSPRPVMPSSEAEMWWERAETRGEFRAREGLLLVVLNPWVASVCWPTLTICGFIWVWVPEQDTSTHPRPANLSLFSCGLSWRFCLQPAVISFMSSLRLADEPRQSCEKEVGGVHQGEGVSTDPLSGLCFSWASWTLRADGGL